MLQSRLYFIATLALAAIPIAGFSAIDFTPRYVDLLTDGISVHSMYLQDGAQKVLLQSPPKWDARAEGGALCLSNPEHSSARVDIRASAVQLPPTVDDKWVKAMTPPLLKSLPKEAENAAITATRPTPIPILAWKSFEFLISYEVTGIKYQRSVCFIAMLKGNNVEMVTTSRDSDFGPARSAGLALLGSWMEPPAKVMERMLQ